MTETLLVIAGVLSLGFGLLYILHLVMGEPREEKIQRLNERHANLSHAENMERRSLVQQSMNARTRQEKEYWGCRYAELKALHQQGWDARVKEIIDLEVPYDEGVLASIERGENPYKRTK